jgi:hypothetical protein
MGPRGRNQSRFGPKPKEVRPCCFDAEFADHPKMTSGMSSASEIRKLHVRSVMYCFSWQPIPNEVYHAS